MLHMYLISIARTSANIENFPNMNDKNQKLDDFVFVYSCEIMDK